MTSTSTTLANTITIAEIKRGGMSALDAVLSRGAATIMKRNRPAAIVLAPQAYEAMLAKAAPRAALDWLLSPANATPPPNGAGLDTAAIAQRLLEAKADWSDR
jgi:PHD/YefM family antitoxin component YafN of YafNO toxin-antitoxin module